MNKNVPLTNKKYWIRFRDGNKWINGMQIARTWYMMLPIRLPTWMLYSWRDVRIDVQVDGLLAPEFRAGKPLIPIVFSHGLTGSGTMYSVMSRELASQGYMVFLIDHQDGSSCFTKKGEDGEDITFDPSIPYLTNYQDMHERVKVRE